MDIDVKINRTNLVKLATCFIPGIWRFCVYSNQDILLPFMGKTPDIPSNKIAVEEMVINNVFYQKKNTIPELIPGYYCQIDNICYFCNIDYYPAWLYDYNSTYNIGIGLTTGKTYSRGDVLYRAGLNYWPQIKDEADNLEAGKMKFLSDSLTVKNNEGEFDNAFYFFGNGVQVFARDGIDVFPLYEYYVKNVKTRLDHATFVLSDVRERLSQKIPNMKFTVDRYPYMQNPGNTEQKSNKLGAIIPDAYGYCVNIPAVCVDQFDIYSDENHTVIKTFRTFKVARKITRLDKVLVKMTQPESSTGSKEVWTDQRALGHITNIDAANGTFTMGLEYCMPPFFGYDVPEIYDVVCTGVFCPEEYPAKIVAEIINYYAGITYDDYNYNIAEFTAELSPFAKIGIYFDKEVDIFSAIEQIQNASTFTFQFKTDFDRFTARRNDDTRDVSRNIKAVDITNINEIEIDMNVQEYATIVDVAYNENHMNDRNREDKYEHIQDLRNQTQMLKIYHVEKQYDAATKLSGEGGALIKADKLIQYFSKLRPMIKDIKLMGREWFSLRVYDIIIIDLRLEIKAHTVPRRLVSIMNYANQTQVMGLENSGPRQIAGIDFGQREKQYREFGGVIKCKVMAVTKDTKTETVTIDLVFVG
jgi:hypothetical protein